MFMAGIIRVFEEILLELLPVFNTFQCYSGEWFSLYNKRERAATRSRDPYVFTQISPNLLQVRSTSYCTRSRSMVRNSRSFMRNLPSTMTLSTSLPFAA